MGRIFAIGDIHGRFDLLAALDMKLIIEHGLNLNRSMGGTDKIIFLGDYVDRGPDSNKVLHYIKSMQELNPGGVVALYGNHEDLMVKAVKKMGQPNDPYGPGYWWEVNGGKATYQSFGGTSVEDHKIPADIIDWVCELPWHHEEPGFFFAHAPLPRENRRHGFLKGQPFDKEEYIWSRPGDGDEPGFARPLEKDGEKVIGVCGHFKKGDEVGAAPRLYEHYWYLDTGCGCYTRRGLAAVEIHSKTVVMVKPDDLRPPHTIVPPPTT